MSETKLQRPTWVRVVIAVVAVLAVMLVVMVLSGGNHGPGRHSLGAPPSMDLTRNS